MKQLLQILLLGTSVANYAQGPSFEWAIEAGGSGVDYGFAITRDPAGNILTTGQYNGVADFEPGSGVINLVSQGLGDIFIRKSDADGNLIWAKSVGTGGDDHGFGITTDVDGNVYVTGYFDGAGDFDPGTGSYTLASNGNRDIFILKLNPGGNLVWAKSIGGVFDDEGKGIAIDGNGDVLICGFFRDLVDFDVTGTIFNSVGTGLNDAFVLKLNSSGGFVWVKTYGGTDDESATAISISASNEIYITGQFGLTVDFDPDSFGSEFLTAQGFWDAYVLKLDVDGLFVWAKTFEGSGAGYGIGHAVTLDNSGNVYVGGYYYNNTDFDPSGNTFYLTSAGYEDGFILKLDLNGSFIWAKSFGGSGVDVIRSLSIDTDGNIFASGNFDSAGDFDPAATTYTLTPNGLFDICLVELDKDGALIWVTSIGGPLYDLSPGILANADGSIYVIGSFEDQIDADYTSDGIVNFTSQGANDILLVKLNECLVDTTIDTHVVCDSLAWIDGNTYFTNNSTASFTLTNVGGCDSVVRLYLTIEPLDISINLSGQTLTAGETVATYQWVECDSTIVPISQEFGQSFTADSDGNYAVIISKDGCVDTSQCIFVDAPLNMANVFSPNGDGFNDVFVMEIENPINTVIIYDRWGSVVKEFTNYDNVTSVWDGTDKSGKLMRGTFYFTLISDQNMSGWVEVVH